MRPRCVSVWLSFVLTCSVASAQPPAHPQVRVTESSAFTLALEPQLERRFAEYVESLVLSDREQRQIKLAVIHQNPLWRLMSYIPLRLKPEVDTFFLRNDMRTDVNPTTDYTFLQPASSNSRFSVRVGRPSSSDVRW